MVYLAIILFILSLFPTRLVQAQQAPAVSVPTNNFVVGAFYMPHHKMGTQDNTWTTLQWFPDHKPLLGYYDEGKPDVMDWEIKWAREHGINAFIFDWFRCRKTNVDPQFDCDNTLGRPIGDNNVNLGHAINEGFLQSRYKNHMQFAVMLTSHHPHSWLFDSLPDLQNNLMPYIINKYMKQPNYLKIDGKPLLFVYQYKDLAPMLGGDVNKARQVVPIMRQAIRDAGLGEAIILGEDRHIAIASTVNSAELIALGFDHTFAYHTPVYKPSTRPVGEEIVNAQRNSYEWMKANAPLPFIYTASPKWDGTPKNYMEYPLSEPKWAANQSEYTRVLQSAASAASQLPAGDVGKRMIIVDAWNENMEGHYLIPTVGTGFMYLKAIREALTQKNNTPDITLPNAQTLQNYSTLYRTYMSRSKPPSYFRTNTLSFNGTSDFYDYDLPLINAPDTISFGAWVKPDNTSANSFVINKGQSFGIRLNPDGSGHCVLATERNAWYSPGTTARIPVGSVKNNEYTHIFCVYTGSSVKVYKNGQLLSEGETPISGRLNIYAWRTVIGRNSGSNEYFFRGNIHAAIVGLQAYPPNAVVTLMNETRPTNSPDKPGDFNGDGSVNIFDYNRLVEKFNNPYTIFDYNALVANFNK